jgi:two-component system, chemotaxis family, chemotaxis protein CheY
MPEVTILVVDDDPDMRMLACAILSSTGITVVGEAADGYEAIDRLRDLDPPPVPTVVLLDNRMPGPSGLAIAARLLERNPAQLIVLFSAYLTDETIAEARRLGVAACVSKKQVVDLPGIILNLVLARA